MLFFGVELFLKKSFNLRLGYNFRRAEELNSGTAQFSGFTWVWVKIQ
jgi:hypothetical protein